MGEPPLLRLARLTDIFRWLLWRNDPDAIKASVRQRRQGFWSHLFWFPRAIRDEDLKLYIVAEGGYLSLVRRGQIITVGINLAPGIRGNGIGTIAVRKAVLIARAWGPSCEIRTSIRSYNLASRRVFEKAGFQPVGHMGELVEYVWTIPSNKPGPTTSTA